MEDAVGPLWKGHKFTMTECISGWSMIHRKTAVIPDVFSDERIPVHLYRDTFVRSLLMAPVGVSSPVGALEAYWSSVYEPKGSSRAVSRGGFRPTASCASWSFRWD